MIMVALFTLYVICSQIMLFNVGIILGAIIDYPRLIIATILTFLWTFILPSFIFIHLPFSVLFSDIPLNPKIDIFALYFVSLLLHLFVGQLLDKLKKKNTARYRSSVFV